MKPKYFILIILILIILGGGIFVLFQTKQKEQSFFTPSSNIKDMKILSPAFENNGFIPEKYTCDGDNINPPLQFEDIPKEAKSLVLIVDDPDAPAGTWIHWTLWNISPQINNISENQVPSGAQQGKTSFGNIGYGGPCPPSGTHRYFFKVFALNKEIDLPSGADINQLQSAIKDHIIAKSQLIGLYRR